jgi:hypothetical protein
MQIFGPYSFDEATLCRNAWQLAYPTSLVISSVFQAHSDQMARRNAHYYLPRAHDDQLPARRHYALGSIGRSAIKLCDSLSARE